MFSPNIDLDLDEAAPAPPKNVELHEAGFIKTGGGESGDFNDLMTQEGHQTEIGDEEEEEIGCSHGIARDYKDQRLGWVLYVLFIILTIVWQSGAANKLNHSYLMFVVPWVVKVLEGFLSPTFRYLLQAKTVQELIKRDSILRDKNPRVSWHMVCSHTEQRTRTVTDKDGRSHRETYTEIVVTHTANEEVVYAQCKDCTPSLPTTTDLNRVDITKFECDIVPEGAEFERMENAWNVFHSRDRSNRFTRKTALDGMVKHSLLLRGDNNGCCSKFLFVNVYAYTIFLVTGFLGMPYRWWLSSITDKFKFEFRKELSGITNQCRKN